MAYNIYYMYDAETQKGYIGQNKDDRNDKRILDHVECYLSGNEANIAKDGAARLIDDMGGLSSSLRYKFFFKETNGLYGIPVEVYEKFFDYWSLDGKTSFNELDENEILDLAEMFHITAAGLQGRSWSEYNTRPGGFDSSKRLTYHFSTQEAEKIEALKQSLPNIRTSFDVTNFSIDLRAKPDAWKKIVYPMGQVVTTAVLDDKLKNLLTQEIWFSLINSEKLQDDLTECLEEQMVNRDWTMPEDWGSNIKVTINKNKKKKSAKDMFKKVSEAIKEVFIKHINTKSIKETTQATIKKVFRNQDLKFHWEFSSDSVDEFVKVLTKRLDAMSLNMWANVFDSFNTKKEKFTSSIFSKNGQGGSEIIKFKLPHIMVDFQWDTNKILPEWATKLKATKLTDHFQNAGEGKLKADICTIICEELFPIIDETAGQQPSKDYLLFRVFNKTADETLGYGKYFLNILLTIWHQYTYGPNAWITQAEYRGVSSDSARANYIANRNLIDQVDSVWWYSGKAWQVYRDAINGSSSEDFEACGKQLAQLWDW